MTRDDVIRMAKEAGAWSLIDHDGIAALERFAALVAAAERKWQGLTDEEVGMLTVFDGLHDVEVPLLADFTRAIEAKLKEKNGY